MLYHTRCSMVPDCFRIGWEMLQMSEWRGGDMEKRWQ